jgi:hypothetical protein
MPPLQQGAAADGPLPPPPQLNDQVPGITADALLAAIIGLTELRSVAIEASVDDPDEWEVGGAAQGGAARCGVRACVVR